MHLSLWSMLTFESFFKTSASNKVLCGVKKRKVSLHKYWRESYFY